MKYLFVNPERVFEDRLLLDREDRHHIRNVLRKKTGDTLEVSDGSNFLYRAKIVDYFKGEIRCSIQDRSPLPPLPTPTVTLLQAIPKGKRMEWLVQKATEVGVHELIPMTMKRSVRVVSADKGAHWTHRWRRVAIEAAKQSGRLQFPRVVEPLSFEEALKYVQAFPLRIFFDEKEKERSLREIRSDYPNPERIAVVVGPEGGISPEECDILAGQGFLSTTLGDMVLRVETAGILSVALIHYEWGHA